MPALQLRFALSLAALALVGVALAAFTVAQNARSEERATVARSQVASQPTATTTNAANPTSASATKKRPARQGPLARALARNRIVIAVLYSRAAVVDTLAVREARAAAASVDAGFVALRPADAARVPSLTRDGVAATPAVLIFRRGPQLVHRITGFADRETVAQAAANAARP